MAKTIAIVEDDPAIRDNYAAALSRHGFKVLTYEDRQQASDAFQLRLPELVIIDITLGDDIDGGFELCRELRARAAQLPIVFLTARDSELDAVSGLRLGADDYLTKPFSVLELAARVRAILRRVENLQSKPTSAANDSAPIQAGSIRIDPSSRSVTLDGAAVDLTAREFDLLEYFARHPGRVFRRAELLDHVWGYGHEGYEHTVNSHINRLRAKIEGDPSRPDFIVTVWGVGYKFSELRASVA